MVTKCITLIVKYITDCTELLGWFQAFQDIAHSVGVSFGKETIFKDVIFTHNIMIHYIKHSIQINKKKIKT